MSVEEAIQLGRRAIFHATHRDAYSGGFVNGTPHFFATNFPSISHLTNWMG
jgi:hypothetical protein